MHKKTVLVLVPIFLLCALMGGLVATIFQNKIASAYGSQTIVANRFQLVDENGETLGVLGYGNDKNPFLELGRLDSQERLFILSKKSGVHLLFLTRDGKRKLETGLYNNGSPYFYMESADGKTKMAIQPDGAKDKPSIDIRHENGNVAAFGLQKDQSNPIAIIGNVEHDHQYALMAFSKETGPIFATAANDKKERILIANDPKEGPMIRMGAADPERSKNKEIPPYGIDLLARNNDSRVMLTQDNFTAQMCIDHNRGYVGFLDRKTRTALTMEADKKGIGTIRWIAMGREVKTIP